MTGTEKLSRYARTGEAPKRTAAPSPAPEQAEGKEPYVAYRLSKGERRYLEIRQKYPEPAEAQSNAMLTDLTGEWRMGLAVSLSYGNTMRVKLRGERLTELFRALQEWRVEFIQEFDPEMHEKPSDPDAPFIEAIEILTERPEPPPPMGQRH